MDIDKEMFALYVRKCLKLGDKRFADDEEVQTEERK
jgi:hypothetical protein